MFSIQFFCLEDLDNMLRKSAVITAAVLINFALPAAATDAEQNFYQDILFSDDLQQQDAEDAAKSSAVKLLHRAPELANPEIEETNLRYQDVEKLQATYGAAPFGLVWGMNEDDVKKLGVRLRPEPMKDYVNSYAASRLPNMLKDFQRVVIVFGEENKLWRVIAFGNFITDDTPDAAKTLKEYNRYYNLLSKKYGNAQQFFTPGAENPDEEQPEQNQTPEQTPDLLNRLLNGQATLYSTFEGKNVGASLSVNVDGNKQTYLVIDYKNLKILNEKELEILDAL